MYKVLSNYLALHRQNIQLRKKKDTYMSSNKQDFIDKKAIMTLLILLALGVIAYLINYFLNVFVAKCLSPKLYGDFSITVQSLTVLAVILLLGSNSTSVKYLSTYIANSKKQEITGYIHWNLKLIIKTFTVTISLCAILYSNHFKTLFSVFQNYH